MRVVVDKLQFLRGYYLSEINWNDNSRYRDGLDKYDLISEHLPLRIDELHCKGKQIFFKLVSSDESNMSNPINADNPISHCFYLNVTLGMEGKFLHEPGRYSDIIFDLCQEYVLTDNQTVIGINGRKLFFDDSRHFGNIFIFTEEQYISKLSTIGPDILAEDIDPSLWLDKAKNGRIKKKQICDFLMEQKYFSGIGNYLKSEILYAARIKPDREMGDISDDEFLTILNCAQQIIRESYQSNGLTIKSYIDPTGETGKYQRLVYDKDVDPNGYTVIRSKFKDNRTTHWVPELQH